jgi:hypothetical protein
MVQKNRYSVTFATPKEYHDVAHKCRCCKESAVFSAADERYICEVRKLLVIDWYRGVQTTTGKDEAEVVIG